jgi:peptidoglycan/xylan/chitin deacetylase (PgdA/CDA1 family)
MKEISRRKFVKTSFLSGVGISILPYAAKVQGQTKTQTRYIAAYDTESTRCLEACRKIVEVHKRFQIPATFFIVGKLLEENSSAYRTLLDDPLFEIASHTYSHKMLRENPFCGQAVSPEEKRKEIFEGKKIIENVFERPCIGVRPGCGFENALKGTPEVLSLIKEAGFKYVSSLLWGPDYSLPALLIQPFSYKADGYADIWELPAHGWHENLLKNNNKMGPKRITLWPPEMPEAIPSKYISNPQEEFAINRVFLEKAVSTHKTFVSLIWHPWSLYSFDPEMKMLELTFTHVRKLGLEPCTYEGLYNLVSA